MKSRTFQNLCPSQASLLTLVYNSIILISSVYELNELWIIFIILGINLGKEVME